MARRLGILSLLIGCYICVGSSEKSVEEDPSDISPALEPKSDAKFFGKDYPWDKRPKVDVLHFKHPYPVVQDSSDYDADFIKDENSDDGSWKAQSEYDRLRHKLAQQKAEVAKALRSKNEAEKELHEAMHRKEEAVKKVTPAPRQGKVQGSRGEPTPVHRPEERPPPSPGGIASPGDVRVATEDTQKAMEALEECKKHLAEARENLKKLMKELDEAKQAQRETQAALDAAMDSEHETESVKERSDKVYKSEYEKYLATREEFLKQQAVVAKMEADLKVAAAKVRSFRDGEDKDGGVYNTGSGDDDLRFKSSACSTFRIFIAPFLVSLAAVAFVVH